jgi:D-xylose 1-dehydrogenase (NADP+, D-xylono-1,5-lactone-forming)
MSVRWGFIGAGFVASRAMAPAVHAASGAILAAVASRDPQRSGALGPLRVHDSYQALIEDPDIDAVYISLRNGQHREWVEQALRAGRHVLCEKPLGLTAAESRAMFTVAEQEQRLLVEAVWMRWHPRFSRMTELVRSGALGELISVDSAFTFTGTEMEGNYRLDPTQGGGALMDVGCYQAHTWLALLGHDAQHRVEMDITDVRTEIGPTGVDLTTSVTAQLRVAGADSSQQSAGEVTASQISSFQMPSEQRLIIRGTLAEMSTGDGETFTNWKAPSSLRIADTEEWYEPVDPFQMMVESVSARIAGEVNADANSRHDQVPVIDSIRVAELLDQIRTHRPQA